MAPPLSLEFLRPQASHKAAFVMLKRVLLFECLVLGWCRLGAQDLTAPTPPEAVQFLASIRLALPQVQRKAMPAWKRFGTAVAAITRKPFAIVPVADSKAAAASLHSGKADFALLNPEDYVPIASSTEFGATLAVADRRGFFGFQVALLVRPDSPFERENDVLYSEAVIGLLKMDGFKGRFYRGPVTDEKWRVAAEIKPRLRFGGSAEELIERLLRGSGRRKVDAVLLPTDQLKPPDEDGLRQGLREVWLSPFCPGRVIVARSGVGKRQRRELGDAFLRALKEQGLPDAEIGGLRQIDDTAFQPLREFLPGMPEE